MSEPDWKVFGKPKPGREPIAEPRIGIARSGVLTLNEKAFEVLGKPEAVELLFNEKEGLAALRAVNPELPTARRVWGANNKTKSVSAASFVKAYALSPTQRRPVKGEMRDEMLVFKPPRTEEEGGE